MSLLEKFDSVKISADSRITAADRAFCEAHQKAYDAARVSLRTLAEMAEKAEAFQKEVMQPLSDNSIFYHSYFADSSNHYRASNFHDRLQKVHGDFIKHIVWHFAETYAVDLDEEEINAAILPEPPKSYGWAYNQEELKSYTDRMESLSVSWQDVLERIFIQLGGFSFADKAEQEIKQKCHEMAWNTYKHTPNFKQKKAVLSFTSMCHCSTYSWRQDEAEMYDQGKDIIKGVSHFENGTSGVALGLESYMGYRFTLSASETQLDGEKLIGIKCFKNGRVDFRFRNEALARQFVEEYCGLVE